jgi:hypothetical protein
MATVSCGVNPGESAVLAVGVDRLHFFGDDDVIGDRHDVESQRLAVLYLALKELRCSCRAAHSDSKSKLHIDGSPYWPSAYKRV